MFSVIIPLYNKEQYIAKAIDSVLAQTYTDFELIIVNDGSLDSSLKIVNQFDDYRIRIINQPNQGVSIARNNGVKAAKYDYIAFLDADDWWDKSFLKEMNSLIDEYPGAGVYGSKYFWVKNGKTKESINHESSDFRGYMNYLKAYTFAWWMPLNSISVVIPKTIFLNENGFKKELKFGEDFDLWIRITLKYKLAYLNQPLAYYNQDVVTADRALGKIWKPENHFIFNLGYLYKKERSNHLLKELLDGLRVRSLIRFRLNGRYKNEVNEILKHVDFSSQSTYFRRIYKWPLFLIRFWFFLKTSAYKLKQMILMRP